MSVSVKTNFNQFLVLITCGLLLLSAGILKLYGVIDVYWSTNQFGLNAIFSVILSLFEIFLFLWLLSGYKPAIVVRIVTGCFGLFALVSLYHLLSGTKSCGCFGPASTSPWLSLLIDLTALAALMTIRPLQIFNHWKIHPFAPTTFSGLLLLLIIFGPGQNLFQHSGSLLMAAMQTDAMNDTNIFQPTKWKGQKLPLLKDLNIDSEISQGHWVIIFYRPDCDICEHVVSAYLNISQVDVQMGMQIHLAFVAVTDTNASTLEKIPGTEYYPNAYLDENAFEDMPTPITVEMNNGIVENVSLDDRVEGGWLEEK